MQMGWGAVVRDHSRRFIFSCHEGLNFFPAPELAEALAIRCALDITRDHDIRRVLLLLDCLSVVQRISSPSRDRSPIGTTISDIKIQTAAFDSVVFKFFGRSSNMVAHTLARSSLRMSCNISVVVIP